MDCLIPALRRLYNNPANMMRRLYKYTDCGASGTIVVEGAIHAPTSSDPWAEAGGVYEYHSDTAHTLGTWDDMESAGLTVLAVRVSSIVEGSEATTDTVTVEASACADAAEFNRMWDAAIEEVEAQARDLWDATHGCAWCGADTIPEAADPYDNRLSAADYNHGCRVCGSRGITL